MGFTTSKNDNVSDKTVDATAIIADAIKKDTVTYHKSLELILELLRKVEDSFSNEYIVHITTNNDIALAGISVKHLKLDALYGTTYIYPSLHNRKRNLTTPLPNIVINNNVAHWENKDGRRFDPISTNLNKAVQQFVEKPVIQELASFIDYCGNHHEELHDVEMNSFKNPTEYHAVLIELGMVDKEALTNSSIEVHN